MSRLGEVGNVIGGHRWYRRRMPDSLRFQGLLNASCSSWVKMIHAFQTAGPTLAWRTKPRPSPKGVLNETPPWIHVKPPSSISSGFMPPDSSHWRPDSELGAPARHSAMAPRPCLEVKSQPRPSMSPPTINKQFIEMVEVLSGQEAIEPAHPDFGDRHRIDILSFSAREQGKSRYGRKLSTVHCRNFQPDSA